MFKTSVFIDSKTSKNFKYSIIPKSLESLAADNAKIKLSLKGRLNKVSNLIVNW